MSFAADASAQPPAGPMVLDADHVEGQVDKELTATGNVKACRDGRTIEAQWVKLFDGGKEIRGGDRTRYVQAGNVINGGALYIKDADHTGYIEHPDFILDKKRGRGDAVKLLLDGPDKYRLENGRFTVCAPGDDDWYIKARTMDIDYVHNLGEAWWGQIEFKGVPILPAPYADFSLDGARKSGLLAPTFSSSGSGGIDISIPWYWNIAPNMDDTVTPRLIAKRGVMLEDEFRYMTPSSAGILNITDIQDDRVFGARRDSEEWKHKESLGSGWTASVNLQRVSDDQYFADYGDRIAVASQTYLPRQGVLQYDAPDFQFSISTQHYQTLQDPAAPIIPPYAQLPKISLNYASSALAPLRFEFMSELDDFTHPTLIDGHREMVYPSFSLPMVTSWGFLTPKIGFNTTQYQLDDGTHLARNLPITSLDTGLYFDRDTILGNTNMIQSLEPRLYYVRIPYKDQSAFPNFDTSLADFNFAEMFSENQFVGGDRINNANELTAAFTSRLIESDTGIERLRFAVGQRFYFDSPQVYVTQPTTGTNVTSSDVVTAVSGQINHDWSVDSAWEYSRQQNQTQKVGLYTRYQPELAKVLNLGYQYDRVNNIHQADVSLQWPISRRWYAVARENWSILDNRTLEAVAGVEYKAGCWAFRMVSQRFVTSTQATSSRFMVQLELNGLGGIGPSPLETLKQSIPGYSKINQPGITP